MKRILTVGTLCVFALLFVGGIVSFIPVFATTTTTTTTSTTHSLLPLVLQGHSPVDLLLIGPDGQIGCVTEPCIGLVPKVGNVVNTFPLHDGAIFFGTTGTGEQTESGPETIYISNPVAGAYTLMLFPSCTFFDPYFALKSPIKFAQFCSSKSVSTSTATTSSSSTSGELFTITICSNPVRGSCPSGSQEIMGSVSGPCTGQSCPSILTTPITISPQGVITVGTHSGVPEFPGYGLATVITIGVVMLVLFRGVIAVKQQSLKANVRALRRLSV